MALAAFSGILLTPFIDEGSMAQALFSLAVYAMIIGTVLVLDQESSAGSWYFIERAFPQVPAHEATSFEERCRRVSDDAQLTAREREVFVLVASGRSAPYIARELGITVSTVNFHIRHIYEKLNVNSKQDLIDLVEIAQ